MLLDESNLPLTRVRMSGEAWLQPLWIVSKPFCPMVFSIFRGVELVRGIEGDIGFRYAYFVVYSKAPEEILQLYRAAVVSNGSIQ